MKNIFYFFVLFLIILIIGCLSFAQTTSPEAIIHLTSTVPVVSEELNKQFLGFTKLPRWAKPAIPINKQITSEDLNRILPDENRANDAIVQLNNLKITRIVTSTPNAKAIFFAIRDFGWGCLFYKSKESKLAKDCPLFLRKSIAWKELAIKITDDTILLLRDRKRANIEDFQINDKINVYGYIDKNNYGIEALIVRKIVGSTTIIKPICPEYATPICKEGEKIVCPVAEPGKCPGPCKCVPSLCIQVITPAKNPQTGECKKFPTPCDVPSGWIKVESCEVTPSTPSIPPTTPPTKLPIISSEIYCDVVVVGAGTGGTAAAIQSARLGATTCLLEETDWIGGQMTAAAVTSMDEGDFIQKNPSGIYKEFIDKIRLYYANRGKSIGTCYWDTNTRCFEPHVGQQVLREMIKNEGSNLRLFERKKVTRVLMSGNMVTGVVTQDGTIFHSKIVIDATEYGDIIPMTGARYRIGNSISDNINPNACIQDITYTAVIKKYSEGVPAKFRIDNPPPGYTEKVKQEFERIVKKNGYDWPKEFGKYPVNWFTHNAYRGIPDSSNPQNYTALDKEKITKTVINWANDYPSIAGSNPIPGVAQPTLKVAYLEDKNFRKKINCEAKLKTLQFIYYVQHELGEQWSIADDEGFDTPYNIEENSCDNIPQEFKEIEKHFPVIPYVRESRRIVGMHTLTASEIKRVGNPSKAQKSFKSALAVGDYHNDLHSCKDDDCLEINLETRKDIPEIWTTGPFQIPFESFIPEKVDGFLVAEKNFSFTRLVNGAARLQPITMLTGQAAGTIAALSVKYNVQPRNLKVILVQDELVKAKSALSLYSFSDVPFSNSYWEDVQIASLYEIMIGYGNGFFGVNDSLTREQFAMVLTRLFNIPTENSPSVPTFVDVPQDRWSYKSVEAVNKAGLMSGCSLSPKKFCPSDGVTRAMLATVLAKWMKLDLNSAPSSPIFADVSPSHWGFKYIQAIVHKGIMDPCRSIGNQEYFCPDDIILRGEMAKFVRKILVQELVP